MTRAVIIWNLSFQSGMTADLNFLTYRSKITFISWCPDDAPQYVSRASFERVGI